MVAMVAGRVGVKSGWLVSLIEWRCIQVWRC